MQDLPFPEYNRRQYRETEPDQLLSRALTLAPAGNFRFTSSGWEPLPYRGFAVVSMLAEEATRGLLEMVQAELLDRCPWKSDLYMLPAYSFHQTVANMLSQERFMDGIVKPGLEAEFPRRVSEAFQRVPVFAEAFRRAPVFAAGAPARGEIVMRLIGLSIFGTALGVLGIFDQEESYQRILHFREAFYGNTGMATLDVRRTRPFIGHVTLAYVETDLDLAKKEALAAAAHELNRAFFAGPSFFPLEMAELRRYDHLSEFKGDPSYPRYTL